MQSVSSVYGSWVAMPQPRKIRILQVVAFVLIALFLLFLVIYAFGGTGRAQSTATQAVLFMDAMPYNLAVLSQYARRRDISISMIVVTAGRYSQNLNEAYNCVSSFVRLIQGEGYSGTPSIYVGKELAPQHDVAVTSKVDTAEASANHRMLSEKKQRSPVVRFQVYGAIGDNLARNEEASLFFSTELVSLLQSTTVDVLVLGPCTDAAWFLEKFPDQRKRIRSVTVAGGAFNHPGNVGSITPQNKVAEIDLFTDPDAADYILRGAHQCPVTMVPLDATFLWSATSYDAMIRKHLSGDGYSESARMVARGLSKYMNSTQHGADMPLQLITALYLADPYVQNGAGIANMPIGVLTATNVNEMGRSVRLESGTNAKVVMRLSADFFQTHITRIDKLPYV